MDDFRAVMEEYFNMEHAELVPVADLQKPVHKVFYLPMHVVKKESSTTTKIRAVFDASMKTSTGVSLNDTLLVGPTVHPPLIDVLLRFHLFRVALTTDVSRMYRAVELIQSDRDLNRFLWRRSPTEPLQDYRMTRVTFGVSASSFAANMAVKRNAIDFALKYPLAAKAVSDSFYVDDDLTGADSTSEAIELQRQLQDLFAQGGFLLRKWSSSEPAVLEHLPPEHKSPQSTYLISEAEGYTKTLRIAWNAIQDVFRLTITDPPPIGNVTKRVLVSDVAKTFDVLGWFGPCTIKVKILIQRLWELRVEWDERIPPAIYESWFRWRSELHMLSDKHIRRCHFPQKAKIMMMQLHRFCDASENAYAAVIYLRMASTDGNVYVSLVSSKTKVAPKKRLTIPRLELCGAYLLARLLNYVKGVFSMSMSDVYAWTDSTIVLDWLVGNLRRFKTYVGNRVSSIIDHIAPDRWNHVVGEENPADCASRGLFPSELLSHELWWNGPDWLRREPSEWPKRQISLPAEPLDEERELCLHSVSSPREPIIPMDRYSSFTRLKRITAWVLRFISACQTPKTSRDGSTSPESTLTVQELVAAETYWLSISQRDHFVQEIEALKKNHTLPHSSCLSPLNPFLDSYGLIRVGGRERNSKLPYSHQHPVILRGSHPITKLIISTEHLRLLHAGPTFLASSLGRRFHIVGGRKVVRTLTRGCAVCRRRSAKPQTQLLGQLPIERVTPDAVFDKIGVDYAGPVCLKRGSVRKPTIVKAYIALFVSLSVKAMHLELVSDVTADAFVAALRRFIARRGKPSLVWSDHGSNFVGAAREMREFVEFLKQKQVQGVISSFCSLQHIVWKFIPEHSPHFGGLWEAAVKSMKFHLKRVINDTKLTFEEFATVLVQVESCLNNRPLVPLPNDDDGVEALTPGHFLIGRPLESLPDLAFSYRSISLLSRWHLCQALVRHFWQRWSSEYLASLRRFTKWRHPSRNARVGDDVVLQEDGLVPLKWPLARVVQVHIGKDLVRVVTVKTPTGTYRRPITKVSLLLPTER